MARSSSAGAPDVELVVTGLTSSGDGVARLVDGRVAFVRGAFPGDTVKARITKEQERLVSAEAIGIVTPSPQRVTSVCTRERCGGCALRGFDSKAQSAAKTDQVLQTLARIAKLDAKAVFLKMHTGAGWHYRHRARLHARHDGQWHLGYHARGSHDIVDLEACPVLWPELEAAALTLARWLADKPKSLGVREIEVAYSRLDQCASAAFQADAEVTGDPFGNPALRYDQPRDFALRFTADVFTQANPAMNEQLVAAVLEATQGVKVLELHSGIGNFSLPLAQAGHSVKAVEESPVSSALAKSNAEGFAIETVTSSDKHAIADATRFDVVLLDPPRVGAREVAAGLATIGPQRVIYVSCDPATLARDLRLLVDGGYRLDSVQTFDMFPQTPHVETLAVLTR